MQSIEKKFKLFAVMAMAFVATSCGNKNQDKPAAQPRSLKVQTMEQTSGVVTTDIPATLQSLKVVEVRPRVDGYLTHIFVKEGAKVKKGQLLFEIDRAPFFEAVAMSKAQLLEAEAALSNAELEVEKTRPLVDEKIVSEYQLKSNMANVEAAKARVAQARAALQSANINLNYARITAPFSGVIGTIPYKEGALVSGGLPLPLTSIASDGDMVAYFSVSETQMLDLQRKEIAQKESGNETTEPLVVELVTADGLLYTEKGSVELASRIVDATTATVTMKGVFPNPSGLLTSGSSAKVRMSNTLVDVVAVPKQATYEMQDKVMVYKCDSTGVVNSVAIKILGADDLSYFTREGVAAGDEVVIEGTSFLNDGAKINPIK